MRKAAVSLVGSVLMTVALALAPAVGAAAPPGARVPSPGANGIGDPYWPTDGNGGYDVQHYDLRLAYDPSTDELEGVATLRIKAVQDLSRFNLDLDGLVVDSVRVDSSRAGWARSGTATDELQITPSTALNANQVFTVAVAYHGVPEPVDDEFGTSGFYTTTDGAIIAGQPHVADTWFPVNDHPADKASYRISVSAPRTLQVVANGRLAAVTSRGGLQTWTWSSRAPMASYLATFAVGKFTLKQYRAGGLSYLDAIDPRLFAVRSASAASVGARADAALSKQPAIIRFLSEVMGPYPFADVGGLVDDADIGFALENQTRPVYDPGFFADDDASDDDSVVVHELAHQWAGDSLALNRWSDIWLNEGFATYAEWRWSEAQRRGTTDQIFARLAAQPASDDFWGLAIGRPGAARIFDGAVYDRGAMTLHALRRQIGEQKFATLNKRWFADYAGANVTTAQFVALAEEVSGQQLDSFFERWLFTAAKPAGLRTGATSPAARRTLEAISARRALEHAR